MDKTEIWNHLLSYEPQELAARDYYNRHGRDLPILEQFMNPALVLDTAESERLRQRAEAFKAAHPGLNAESLRRLDEDIIFTSGCNVALNKEHRFVEMYPHMHGFFEMECVLQGTCRHLVGGGETPMRAGDIVIVPPGIEHQLIPAHDCVALNIKIRKSTFQRVFTNMLEQASPLVAYLWRSLVNAGGRQPAMFCCGEDEFLREQLLFMYGQQLNGLPYAGLVLESLTQAFLCYLMQNHSPNIPPEAETRIALMQKHIALHARELTLSVLAQRFFMTPSYLSRYIREQTDKTFTRLLTEARLQNARRLLEESDLKVDRVCQLAGYSEVTYFIRIFKKEHGVTPKQYRLQYRKKTT